MSCIDAQFELCAYTLVQPRPPFIHQLAVDAYAVQHLEEGRSPISILFGLMGLFMVVEQGATGLEVQQAHQRKAKDPGRANWPKPTVQRHSFPMNVGHVLSAAPGPIRDHAIHRWVESTWQALPEAHEVIRHFCLSR